MSDQRSDDLKRDFEVLGNALWKSAALNGDLIGGVIRNQSVLDQTSDNGQGLIEALTETNLHISNALKSLVKAGVDLGLDKLPMPPPTPVVSLVVNNDRPAED